MEADVREELGATLGGVVSQVRALSGGDISRAFAVTLADGREVFVKTNRRAPPGGPSGGPSGMFTAEGWGLRWLAEAGALRVPAVIAVHERFLVLELVRVGERSRSFHEDLGRGLAALHRAAAPGFGLAHDNFIGSLPQSNRPAPRWSEFYARERIEPQLRRATEAGRVTPGQQRAMGRLLDRLDTLVGPDEPPARLHGDLWSGNLLCTEDGAPCLIDPAVYGGHREVDLAMMRLFGGFSARTFGAYEESFKLADGHAERVSLYQLYPLLVHLNLFGSSYLTSIESALASLL